MTIMKKSLFLFLVLIEFLHIHVNLSFVSKLGLVLSSVFFSSSGGEVEYRTSFSEREPCSIKKSKTGEVSLKFENFLWTICLNLGLLSINVVIPNFFSSPLMQKNLTRIQSRSGGGE